MVQRTVCAYMVYVAAAVLSVYVQQVICISLFNKCVIAFPEEIICSSLVAHTNTKSQIAARHVNSSI